ncbi:MAG: galactose-1-phosphate uridylyltransferase [Solirubrobacteraceae bacterium]
MPEVRIDPLSGQRVIVADGRAGRPGSGLDAVRGVPDDGADDPFAEGNEASTTPEVYAVRDGSAPDTPGWRVRVFPNRYPALEPDAEDPPPSGVPDLFWSGAARGAHEVIVNAPDPVMSLAELAGDQVALAVEVWRERMRVHADAACLHLSVNEGRDAGASVPHTHAQLFALEFVPAAIARERERFGAYATRTMGGNLLGDLLQQEVRRRERVIAIDDEAVLLAAYGARAPYQLMLVPRAPRLRFEDDGPTGAAMLHDGLRRLRRRLGHDAPLNLWVRTAPRGAEHFCWRIDIVPRLTNLAGFELGTGVGLNIVDPEQAAAELREA